MPDAPAAGQYGPPVAALYTAIFVSLKVPGLHVERITVPLCGAVHTNHNQSVKGLRVKSKVKAGQSCTSILD